MATTPPRASYSNEKPLAQPRQSQRNPQKALPPPTTSSSAGEGRKEERVELRRSLGLWNGVSIIIGVIVGSGIFVSPKGVLLESGSVGAALLVWTGCGLLALVGALCFAELGTSIEASGGEYTYIKLAYGSLPGYLYLWVTFTVIMPCGNAVSALTFANYCLQPLFPASYKPPEHAIRLIALAIIMLLVYVNCATVRGSIWIQNSFTLAKCLALTLIIGLGLKQAFSVEGAQNFNNSSQVWAGTQTSLPHLAQAFYAGFYTYSGWNSLNCVTEEMKEPRRNMPRAIILSITTITIIYILTNAAYFSVLTKQQILQSDAIAVLLGEQALSSSLNWLMPITVALSTMGGLNGSIFAASRVLFAGARQGQLFSALAMINPTSQTPIPSLIFLGLISALYLFTTEILVLINYMTFVEASFAALGVSTVLTLRYKLPELARPFKVPTLLPILYLVFSSLLILLPVFTSPIEASIGLSILLAGLPAYYLTAHWHRKPVKYQEALDSLNLVIQKLTLSLPTTAADASDGSIGAH